MPYASSPYYKTPKTLYATVALSLYSTVDKPKPKTKKVAKGQAVGTTTGLYWQQVKGKGRTWLEIKTADGQRWFVRGDQAAQQAAGKAIAPAAATAPNTQTKLSTRTGEGGDGATCVKNIAYNDQQTSGNLARAVYYRTKLANGRASVVDTALDAQLQRLLARYTARQKKLRESTLLKVQTSLSSTVQSWMKKARALISGPSDSVGALPLVVVVPVVILALIGTGFLLWKAFGEDEPRSVADVLESAKLTEVYQGMDEDEKKLLEETAKKTGEAGEAAADNSFFGKLKNNILMVGAGILVFSYATRSNQGTTKK